MWVDSAYIMNQTDSQACLACARCCVRLSRTLAVSTKRHSGRHHAENAGSIQRDQFPEYLTRVSGKVLPLLVNCLITIETDDAARIYA